MSGIRDTYKYYFKVGNQIVHVGITSDLSRREGEHRRDRPNGHIVQVGNKVTREAALQWEREEKQRRFG